MRKSFGSQLKAERMVRDFPSDWYELEWDI